MIVRLVGLAVGGPTPHDGEFLVEYDPTWLDHPTSSGRKVAVLKTTGDHRKARRFETMFQAIDYAMQISPNKRFRDDGELNRPLRAYHLSFETFESEVEAVR